MTENSEADFKQMGVCKALPWNFFNEVLAPFNATPNEPIVDFRTAQFSIDSANRNVSDRGIKEIAQGRPDSQVHDDGERVRLDSVTLVELTTFCMKRISMSFSRLKLQLYVKEHL